MIFLPSKKHGFMVSDLMFLDRDQALKRIDLHVALAALGAEDFKKGEPLPDWLRNGFV